MTQTDRNCPFCKQPIKAEALKCKHCKADLIGAEPDHGGTCPLCKEEIDPAARRCHHCLTDLTARGDVAALAETGLTGLLTVEGHCAGSVIPIGPLTEGTSMAAMAGPGNLGLPDGLGGGFIRWRRRCFYIPVPVCDVIEEVDPIAGFKPPRYENCRWEWVRVCILSPI